MPKGARNAYVCPAGHYTVTVDLDEGTTPATIHCPEYIKGTGLCSRLATSMWYPRPTDGWPCPPTHGWYKPSLKRAKRMGELDHVQRGGLLLRRLVPGDDIPPQPGLLMTAKLANVPAGVIVKPKAP